MGLGPTPTGDDAFAALRAFMLSALPQGVEVVQAQDNRVPQPAGSDFVTMNDTGRRRLSANTVTYAAGAALIKQPVELGIQVDVYGPAAADNVAVVTTLLRDGFSDLWFKRQGWFDRGVAVLDCADPRQMAFVDGESQYEDRWSFDVTLQLDQVTSPFQDFADRVEVTIHPPPI